MKDGLRNKLLNQSGFTLAEILIAITLFAFFIIAFLKNQGQNIYDSTFLKEEIILKELCENKLNEIILYFSCKI